MAANKKLVDLEKQIATFYDRYSAKRVALSTFLVGCISLFASLGVYAWLESGLFAALAGLLFGFAGINIAFLMIVPPAKSLQQAKQLICDALKEPSRIKSANMQKVQLLDGKGTLHTLAPRDMSVWKKFVVPYLIETQTGGTETTRERPTRTLTASERKYIDERRKEVLEMEKKIAVERASLEKDRSELESRTADLDRAEEMMITRLNGVEQAEAELEQLRIVAAERANQAAATFDKKAAQAQAAELRAKEAQLADLKERLAQDRSSFEQQKAEVQHLQKGFTRTPFQKFQKAESPDSLEAREAALEARARQLEDEAQELEQRVNFVTDSENSLIERLDALTHREATVEQREINEGLRKD